MSKAKRNHDVLFFLILATLLTVVVAFVTSRIDDSVSESTKELCWWYARQDHSGEIGKVRFEKMGYLWVDFDWYESCIKNNR